MRIHDIKRAIDKGQNVYFSNENIRAIKKDNKYLFIYQTEKETYVYNLEECDTQYIYISGEKTPTEILNHMTKVPIISKMVQKNEITLKENEVFVLVSDNNYDYTRIHGIYNNFEKMLIDLYYENKAYRGNLLDDDFYIDKYQLNVID